jgi:molybdenum transport protein
LLSRDNIVVCGTEEARRIIAKLGGTVEEVFSSGCSAQAGQVLLTATGSAATLHLAWKVCINVLEYASGIATRTRALFKAARAISPHIEIVSTRKGFPGTRELASKAVLAGGGSPHRLGLSETILVFSQHRAFLTSTEEFARQLPAWKARAPEKKFLIEATSLVEAIGAVRAGADGVQFDKASPAELVRCVEELRAERAGLVLIAAGGINLENVGTYAATGVDALATSTVYHGPPADIAATMEQLSDA